MAAPRTQETLGGDRPLDRSIGASDARNPTRVRPRQEFLARESPLWGFERRHELQIPLRFVEFLVRRFLSWIAAYFFFAVYDFSAAFYGVG